jgi:hypothetical protein
MRNPSDGPGGAKDVQVLGGPQCLPNWRTFGPLSPTEEVLDPFGNEWVKLAFWESESKSNSEHLNTVSMRAI